jgi:hypothetical protein
MKNILLLLFFVSFFASGQVNKDLFDYAQITSPDSETKIRARKGISEGYVTYEQIAGGASIGSVFSTTLSFSKNFNMLTTQSANITFTLGTGNINDTYGTVLIDGDAVHRCFFSSDFIPVNSTVKFDSSLSNVIYFHYFGGKVRYNILKSAIIGAGSGGYVGGAFSNVYSNSLPTVNQIAKSPANPTNLSFSNGTTDSPFSITYWVKWAATGAATQRFVFAGTTTGGMYDMEIDNSGKIYLVLFSPGGDLVKVTTSSITAGWHHIAETYSGSGTNSGQKIYVDGSLVSTTSANSGSYTAMAAFTGSTYVCLGGATVTGYEFPATGSKFDELAIWSKELLSTEVLEIYASGTVVNLTGLSFAPTYLKQYTRFENNLTGTVGATFNSITTPTYSTDKP